jgi:hypothetical protein
VNILVYAGFTLLGVTLVVLLLIGVLDVVRGTPVRRVLADEKGVIPSPLVTRSSGRQWSF